MVPMVMGPGRPETLILLSPICPLLSCQMHQVAPAIPHWVGMFMSQIQSRPQPPRKVPLPQLLHVVAPVPRPTFCTLQLSMGPPVTFQRGKWDLGTGLGCLRLGSPSILTPLTSTLGIPASLRLQTLGVQPLTQLHSWSCSLGQGAQDTQRLHPQHPLPHTSSKGAPFPYPTLVLGLTWMWAPNLCTEQLLGPSASLPVFHHKPQTSSSPAPQPSYRPHSLPLPLVPSPTPNGSLGPPPTT